MTDQNIGIRVGAVSNQAANILSGSWRALADGTLTEAQLIELHGDIAKGLLQNAQDLEASFGLATHLGATAASPQEAAAFQPQQQAPQQGFTPANNVVQAPFGQQEPQAQFGPTTRVTAQPVQQGQNFQPATAAPGTGGSKADNEWMALFNSPGDFYDNRQDKRSPNGPDFKHKQSGDGLWLNGKFGPAPQWVLDRLQGGFGPVQ